MVLNEEQWIKELREKRIAYGISQGRLAVASGITREYLNNNHRDRNGGSQSVPGGSDDKSFSKISLLKVLSAQSNILIIGA